MNIKHFEKISLPKAQGVGMLTTAFQEIPPANERQAAKMAARKGGRIPPLYLPFPLVKLSRSRFRGERHAWGLFAHAPWREPGQRQRERGLLDLEWEIGRC
jgi:hypothetical protein